MTLPAIFPDWLPGWAQLALTILAILFGLAFLLMPFSVFGVKARIEAVEMRLDEIQAEIRSLAMRLPEPAAGSAFRTDAPPIPPAEPAYQPREPTIRGSRIWPNGRTNEAREEPRLR